MRISLGPVGLVVWGVLTVSMIASPPAAASEAVNACGCYRNDQGVCQCTKKSKCGCPEECEPVGCDAKRAKEADRQADAALKQIAARERKKASEATRQSKVSAKPSHASAQPKPGNGSAAEAQRLLEAMDAPRKGGGEVGKKAADAGAKKTQKSGPNAHNDSVVLP